MSWVWCISSGKLFPLNIIKITQEWLSHGYQFFFPNSWLCICVTANWCPNSRLHQFAWKTSQWNKWRLEIFASCYIRCHFDSSWILDVYLLVYNDQIPEEQNKYYITIEWPENISYLLLYIKKCFSSTQLWMSPILYFLLHNINNLRRLWEVIKLYVAVAIIGS